MKKCVNGVLSRALRPASWLALVLALGAGCGEELPAFQNPEEFQKNANGVYALSAGPAEVTIVGKRYCLRSYNGKLTAPTLRVPASNAPRQIRMSLENDFQGGQSMSGDGMDHAMSEFNITNLHTHGLHVRPDKAAGSDFASDNVLLEIQPGGSQQYRFDIDEMRTHQPGTFWYHPHVHGSTAVQVANGMAGALIIEGEVDGLAGIRDSRERIFLLQQIPYDADGVEPLADGEKCAQSKLSIDALTLASQAESTLINGLLHPQITVPPGQVERWRFIHAGDSQYVNVSVYKAEKDDCSARGALLSTMQQIAADGITFQKKEQKQKLLLAPGYRADVMFQAPLEEGTYCVMDDESPRLNPPNGSDGTTEPANLLAVVRVDKSAGPRTGGLPSDEDLSRVAPAPLNCEGTTDTRQDVLFAQQYEKDAQGNPTDVLCEGKGFFNINCKAFNKEKSIPRVLTLGRTEDWQLSAEQGAHPFHIHVNHVTVCAGTVDGEEITQPHWRDTLMVEKPVRVRTTYEDFTGKFMMHCHLLHHEDQGMMELMSIQP